MTKNEGESLQEISQEDFAIPSSIYDGKFTKTTQFMLPSVSLNVKNRNLFKYFVNAFLDDREHEHDYLRPIFILFSVPKMISREWKAVNANLVSVPGYLTDYNCGIQDMNDLIMYVYTVPEEYEADYYHFRRGRYSKFSERYRNKFQQHTVGEDYKRKESILWQVITLSPELKKSLEEEFKLDPGELDNADEIWDVPRPSREYYRYKATEEGGKEDV